MVRADFFHLDNPVERKTISNQNPNIRPDSTPKSGSRTPLMYIHEGEVSRIFPRRTFWEMRGSEKNFSSQISKNKAVFFAANERDSIFHQYRRRRLK